MSQPTTSTQAPEIRHATIQIADYQPHPRNYNGHPERQIERIARSLTTFGQPRSIVVWHQYIIAGHGVVQAARSLGWTELHANVLPDDYPEHLALAYLAADNELSRLGDPDQAALAAILEEARATDPALMQAIGYDDRELAELIRNASATDGDDRHTDDRLDDAAQTALVAKWQTAAGQLWECGRSVVMCGDSTSAADVDRLLAGRTAALLIADPPYNVGIDYAGADVDDDRGDLEYEQFTRAWFDLWRARTARAIVTPAFVNLPVWIAMYRKRIKQVAPWLKTNSMTRGYISRFACWEPILFFGEADPTWEPVLFVDGDAPAPGEKWKRIRNNDIFNYPVGASDPINLHPCPKPPAMIADMINSYTDIDDLVIDPFNGSGTTLIAAERLIRRAAVMEINPIWVASTLERFQMETGTTPRRIA